MSKQFTKVIKPKNDLKGSYDIIKKIITDQKIKVQKDVYSKEGFKIECKETGKSGIYTWNTPFIIQSEIFNSTLTIKFTALNKTINIAQSTRAQEARDSFISNFELYDNI